MKCANPNCNNEFTPKNATHKYCSSHCRDTDYNRRHPPKPRLHQKPKPKPKPKPKVVKVRKTLEQWIREAEECNLDYGTYRALITAGKTFEELKATAHTRHLPTHSTHKHRWRD